MQCPFDPKPRRKDDCTVTLKDAIYEYLLDCQARNLSPQTLRWYAEKLRALRRYAETQQITEVSQLSPKVLREFLAELRTRPSQGKNPRLSGHTLAGFDQVLRSFCGFLVREELIQSDPMRRIGKLRRPKTEIQVFSPDEVERMLAVYSGKSSYVEHRNYCILLCLYDTAIRLSELVKLRVEHVNLQAWSLTIVSGKWTKDRKVPIGKTLRAELAEFIPRRDRTLKEAGVLDKGYLFASSRGGSLSPSVVYRRIVRAAGEKAGIEGKRISPHTWRHTASRAYLLNGGDAFSLQALLGHETLDMTRRYVQLVERDVRMLHRRHSPLDRLHD